MPSRSTTAISVVLAAAIGWLGAVAYQTGAQKPAKKPSSTTAENRQNKELQKLSQPPSESIHKTSRGEL